ncbi:MAG: C25 family cysteine peptidase, partial [Cyclobacteriaceae bacterium]
VPSWQKEGLHLSGGIKPEELVTFRAYVDGFKTIAENPYWGANVNTIAKRDPNPVELINISDKVNAGVNLITFFGHSSPSTIDIDIGYVSDPTMGYNNPGKYPTFLINGCNAGNFFSGTTSFGEDWILTANKGARNFIAHSSFGFVYSLKYYSDLFYQIGFADSVFVKKGIGDVQKEVARQYMVAAPATMANITQVQQMVLLGDPAVKLFNFGKPDYEITSASLSLASFDNKPVTATSDSFAIKIVLKNLGLAKTDPVKIKLTRELSDGSPVTYDSLFAPILNTDTLFFKIYRQGNTGGGNNQFTVNIDSDNKIDELQENNNEASFSAFIPSNATLNLFPTAYAIVNQQNVKLIWQSTDLLSVTREFDVQIDTTASFNSSYLISQTVSGKVLASTQINLVNADSVVYFWRTRFKTPQPGESGEWSTSTFSYFMGSPEGWAQIRYEQLLENFFSSLIPPGEGTPFSFEETSTSVSIKTFGSDNPSPVTDVSVKINNSEYNLATQGQPCRNNTLNLIAFNKTTAIPYAGLPFNFQDPRTCGREPQLINSFITSELETGLNDDLAALVDAIGVSDSVVLFSIGNPGYTSWSANVKTKLGELGIGLADLDALQAGEPVIIFGRKGATPGTAKITRPLLSPASEQVITVNESITGRKTEGFMKSVIIGPASEWKQFVSNASQLEPADQITFSVYGVSQNGNEIFIADAVGSNYDLSSISVQDYPYLKLTFNTKDEVNLTPAQWENWAVLYEPVAEGILLLKSPETSLTVQEGQTWNSTLGFTNISSKNFNSPLQVDLEIVNKQTQNREQQNFTIAAPVPGDTTFFDITSSTLGKVGKNDVNVFVNKRVLAETYYDNNFIALPDYLNVLADNTSPILDVTFDTRTLRNGDYVSSTPEIIITMVDESLFRFKSDTLGVTLLLSYPCGSSPCPFTRIPFSGDDVKWFAATLNSNFRIEFTPQLADGDYVLSAQLADASGNLSGATPYEISFKVKSEPSLSLTSVFPNPSTGDFFFSFILTGNELPDEFLLEIFTTQGQRQRTFTSNSIQQFNIGTNQLLWDGREATGAYLPRGVYVYRMRVKTPSIETSTQGKLVLMR